MKSVLKEPGVYTVEKIVLAKMVRYVCQILDIVFALQAGREGIVSCHAVAAILVRTVLRNANVKTERPAIRSTDLALAHQDTKGKCKLQKP
ncbi:UNVERIFIED_CONTAM: hypothetical protein NCL1_49881 [Trichonephila clavipes]